MHGTWAGQGIINRVNMLKTVLYSFMDIGYASLRDMEKQCKINIRYMYLMDYEQPSYRSFINFINEEIEGSIEDIFKAVMDYIIREALWLLSKVSGGRCRVRII